VIAALKVLEIIRRTGKKLSELKTCMKTYPQVLENVRVSKKEDFKKYKDIQAAIEQAQNALGSNGRVFVRYSGTEPIARVMIEGEIQKTIEELAKNIAAAISRNLA
jgi:phosphoglucosamine mutase